MWYWEVIFKDKQGQFKTLRSECGFSTLPEAFTAYLEDVEGITEALKELKCDIVLAEHMVFDNNHIFKGGV